jgi:thioredoxin 1
MTDIKIVDDSNFDSEVINATGLVMVEFGASWCGPCVQQLPIMEKFATINLNLVKVCSLNIDNSPLTTTKFGIRSVPTILVFDNGLLFNRKVGMASSQKLSAMLVKP